MSNWQTWPSPETFFLVLGMSVDSAKEMAERYQYEALEFKETSHRVDGVFRPKEPGLPLYFLEVQFYRLPSVFADVLVKAYTYLKQHDPGQAYCGVVLFASRSLEPEHLAPYQPLLDAGLIRRYYLDEMPEIAGAPLGLSILYLIRQTESQAVATARALVVRCKKEIEDEALRADLVEFIETVIFYKLPRLSREEIQAMLQVSDLRQTRVYQEAKEEGFKEGIEQGIEKGIEKERQRSFQEKLRSIAKMAALKMSADDIADLLGLDVDLVRKEMAKHPS
jgi:predicted transposase/invertase (TIGR01784 family)